MTILLTDIDDTILEFTNPFWEWILSKGYEPKVPKGSVYDLTIVLGVTVDEAMALIAEYTTVIEFEMLKPVNDACVVLPELYKQGYRFAAITATVDSEDVRQKRLRNLKTAFGFDWEDCHCTGLRKAKTPFLKLYEPTLWIEDNFAHAVDGHENGHESFIITRDYNRDMHHPNVKRVESWYEIRDHLNATP